MTREEIEAIMDLAIVSNGSILPSKQAIIDLCETALSLLPADPAPEDWRPIETAPKDGSRILVFEVVGKNYAAKAKTEPLIALAYWTCINKGGWVSDFFISEPSHWMPLPEYPATYGAKP